MPDSGVGAALGYAERSGIPYELGLIRNHYVGRTFIEPRQGIRHIGVKVKMNPMPEMIGGKRVVVVEDSIVRGTTSRKIVKMIRSAGAREVHLRISSPPIQWPCYYGIDTPTRKELIGSSHSVDEICRYLGADTLGYLSLPNLLRALGDVIDRAPPGAKHLPGPSEDLPRDQERNELFGHVVEISRAIGQVILVAAV